LAYTQNTALPQTSGVALHVAYPDVFHLCLQLVMSTLLRILMQIARAAVGYQEKNMHKNTSQPLSILTLMSLLEGNVYISLTTPLLAD